MAVTIDGSAGITTNAGGSVNPSTTIDGINYSCRAWVNFNGTGTPAIRASGNVTSITDNGTGDYTVNFTTAMADVNYCSLVTGGNQTGVDITGYANIRDPATQKLVGSVRVQIVISTSTPYDSNNVNVAIFR
jgi:hypothetical protein